MVCAMRGGDSPCFRRVATHPPSLPRQRISLGLFVAEVDDHQEGRPSTEHEECDDGEAGDRFLPRSRRVVDHDGPPGAEQCEGPQSEQLDVAPQLRVVEPADEAQNAVYHGIPSVLDEPADSVHPCPTSLLVAPRIRYMYIMLDY